MMDGMFSSKGKETEKPKVNVNAKKWLSPNAIRESQVEDEDNEDFEANDEERARFKSEFSLNESLN